MDPGICVERSFYLELAPLQVMCPSALLPLICYDKEFATSCQPLFPDHAQKANRFYPSCLELLTLSHLYSEALGDFKHFLCHIVGLMFQ